jgi:hypothetical protein
MTATESADLAPPVRPAAESLILKIPFWGKAQNTIYSLGLIQWAVGVVTAGYILVTQGKYFGKSLKFSWDHLNQLWHFQAVPLIGDFLDDNWDLGRHLYFRAILESILAYAFVSMIVPKLMTKPKRRVPLAHRVMVRLGMPSPYMARLRPDHPDTSGLQYVFLFPSVWIASWPGQIVSSVIIFGGMALGHRAGFHPSWFQPEGIITVGPVRVPWVPVLIGIAGGQLWGHSPAGKAGADIQRRWLDRRLSVYYLAEKLLDLFSAGKLSRDKALAQLTALPDALPSQLYPATYRTWYQRLLAEHAPARPTSRWTRFVSWLVVAGLIILGLYGIYAQRWGIPHHNLWIP